MLWFEKLRELRSGESRGHSTRIINYSKFELWFKKVDELRFGELRVNKMNGFLH